MVERKRPADRRGLRVGSILGVPVYVSPTWLLIAGVIVIGYEPVVQHNLQLSDTSAYLTAVVFVVLLFASVLAHELGHALTALSLGIRVRAMTLWMLGGYTEMESEPRSPGGEFLVAAAGPAVSAVLGLAGLAGTLALDPTGVPHELAGQVMWSNLSVAVFNLLPGLPLDGGSLVRAAVWRLVGDRTRGTVIAGWAGRVVAVLVLAVSLGLALFGRGLATTGLLLTVAVGVFLWTGATQSIKAARYTARMPALDARRLARPTLTVLGDVPLAEALRRASEAGARGIVVVNADGAATAVVAEHAVAATPPQRRPWVSVAAVARTLEPGMIIPADLTGERLIRAMQATPSAEYVVSDGEQVLGVLVAGDVVHTLENKGTT
jgi:Zn-dependent protease/CBS domain-containing protein